MISLKLISIGNETILQPGYWLGWPLRLCCCWCISYWGRKWGGWTPRRLFCRLDLSILVLFLLALVTCPEWDSRILLYPLQTSPPSQLLSKEDLWTSCFKESIDSGTEGGRIAGKANSAAAGIRANAEHKWKVSFLHDHFFNRRHGYTQNDSPNRGVKWSAHQGSGDLPHNGITV